MGTKFFAVTVRKKFSRSRVLTRLWLFDEKKRLTQDFKARGGQQTALNDFWKDFWK